VVTVIAGAGGWILGGILTPDVEKPEIAKKPEVAAEVAEGEKEDGLPRLATEANGVIQLEPITTNLAFPADRWVRLEVALLFKDKPDVKLAETIHQDIAVYLRTVSLQQIEGPRGFQYLKEDLEERTDMISEGKVSKLMFRTFLIQ
jgi:flagellar FliL protein